jgi:arylsulfatase
VDPFKRGDTPNGFGPLPQKVSGRVAPMGEPMTDPLMTLAQYRPVRGGKGFGMLNGAEHVMSQGHN